MDQTADYVTQIKQAIKEIQKGIAIDKAIEHLPNGIAHPLEEYIRATDHCKLNAKEFIDTNKKVIKSIDNSNQYNDQLSSSAQAAGESFKFIYT